MDFHQFTRTVQKIVLYETKSRLYIVGSNHAQTKFRIIKIDRTEPRDLLISDDKVIYDPIQIREVLNMIDVGNRSKVGQKIGSGFNKTISSYGIIGFVRFLEGYYVLLITKRMKAAMLGHHSVFKIEDTAMVYIPNDEVREAHPDEARYVKMFQAIDLSSNFYFSYSYDLTNSVQYNMENPVYVTTGTKSQKIDAVFEPGTAPNAVAYLGKPNQRYLWNDYLIGPMRQKLHHDWTLNVIHGFVDQSNISVYGSPVLLTLIARRSNRFAGTRFLKRGANFSGDVANEVETEQIVMDSSISNLEKSNVTSFVQIRGSVPGQWSQDTTTMVPKPQIYFQASDPICRISGKHFNQLMTRYGSPVVILNLVKKRERRRKHESLLSDYLQSSVTYLNTFLHEENFLQYIHFDMARCSKKKNVEVMAKLAEIATVAINKTGIFQSQKPYYWESLNSEEAKRRFQGNKNSGFGSKQTGIVRTNCVDCLDRTNTAQFVIAKVALGLQLYALGYLQDPHLEYDCDCSRMLEAMFEDHGDTLALQYGGSQLIHRIKSYRKESKWTSRANDITQTVRRYYSNAMTDIEKQNTMNLFLGVFVPQRGKPALWDKDAPHDSYLHSPELCDLQLKEEDLDRIQLRWWDIAQRKHLPFSVEESRKECLTILRFDSRRETFDLYCDQYHPHQLSIVSDLFSFKEVSHSVRDYMPHCETDFSPFVVREREGKRREDNSANQVRSSFAALISWGSNAAFASSTNTKMSEASKLSKNPSVAGTSSTASNTSQTSEESEEESNMSEDTDSELDFLTEIAQEAQVDPDVSICDRLTFETEFESAETRYGIKFVHPSKEDMKLYDRWVDFDKIAKPRSPQRNFKSIAEANTDHLFVPFDYKPHDYRKQLLPMPSPEDMEIYENYLRVGRTGHSLPTKQDLDMYMDYVKSAKIPTKEDLEVYQNCLTKIEAGEKQK